MIPELVTERLRLRGWRDADAEPLARLNADPLVMRHMGEGPMSREASDAQLRRFREHWPKHGFGLWALEDRATGELVGRAGLSYHSMWPEDPEVGWLVAPELWGRGLATEAGAAAVEYGFRVLGAPRLVSICTEENLASRRVMAKLGFHPLGERVHAQLGIPLWIHVREREPASLSGATVRDR